MAENQEGRSNEDLTEEASPYRLEEYRRKGMVAQSREVTALLALLATGAADARMAGGDPGRGHTLDPRRTHLVGVSPRGEPAPGGGRRAKRAPDRLGHGPRRES